MSHITTVKELLSDDLKNLLKVITGFEEGTQEFKKCEDSAWSIIIDRYYPSVNERQAKATLYEFVHKFKVHGFPQKAKNLSMLIEAYSNHPYFHDNCSTDVQWGLVDFLMKLSRKPTNCKKDDPPLDLANKFVKKDEESFDWGTYLKEGWEKFRLPSEDGSLSDWSDEELIDIKVEENVPNKPCDSHENNRPHNILFSPVPEDVDDLEAKAQQRKDAAKNWIKTHTQNLWWNNKTFREIPKSEHPEANICARWESTNSSCDTRILSEYKVLRELLYVLSKPTDCYFIKEEAPNIFKVTPKTSISSLTPMIFTIAIEENFCIYLPDIRRLQSFCSEISHSEMLSCVPATYRSYSAAIRKILHNYNNILFQLEKKVDAQESITTIHHLIHEISPFLDQIHYLNTIHEEAIPPNWRERDLRTNAFRLLCTLYNELKYLKKWIYGDTSWPSHNLLILFLESLYPFLKFLAQYMTGYPHTSMAEEFFLSSTGEILVDFKDKESKEFWKVVLRAASSAITSCSFLTKLGEQTHFFKSDYPTDILFVKVVEKLHELLFYKPLNSNDTKASKDCNDNQHESGICPELFDGGLMDQVFREVLFPPSLIVNKPPVCDKFSDSIREMDLRSNTTAIALKNAIKYVVEEYMEPKGFASEILLDKLKFLDHLNALYTSLQVTSVFSSVITKEFQKCNEWKRVVWFLKFENCLSDVLPQEFVQNFRFVIDRNLLNDISIFDLSDYDQLNYKTMSTLSILISDEIVEQYSLIFRFLLKTRITLGVLNRLLFQRLKENENNTVRIRRLCSLRLWLLHVMNTINLYFSNYNNIDFQRNMKQLCLNERNLHSILEAHEEFVKNWKHHCFVPTEHPCHENILELISLCAKLNMYYGMEQKGLLADYHLDDLEQAYMNSMKSFASNLQLFDERLVDKNDTFSFLYDEVINNLPVPQDSSLLEHS